MANWSTTLCINYSLSTPIIIIAVIVFLLNLYFNSDSKFARKSDNDSATDIESDKDGRTAYTKRGRTINGALSLISLVGILLAFAGC